MASVARAPVWPHTTYEEQFARSMKLGCGAPGEGHEGPGLRPTSRSGSSTPTSCSRRTTPPCSLHCRSRTSRHPSEGAASRCSSRATTPLGHRKRRVVRSVSPRPRSESDALVAPVVGQEAVTRALLYPSTLHTNLRLAAIVLVTAHVSFKTLWPWLVAPVLNRLALEWTPQSVEVSIP